jgi:hypothetical protein
MTTDNTLPSGIHDLMRLGDEMRKVSAGMARGCA